MGDEIPRNIIADLLRHRYTYLKNSNPNNGVSTGSLSQLINFLPKAGDDEDIDNLSFFLELLGDFDHIRDLNISQNVQQNIFSKVPNRSYRIHHRESGYLPVDEQSEFSLLFDHRSSIQLKSDFPDISLTNLSTGHRIIHTDEAINLGFSEFLTYPDCLKLPNNPIDLLNACFSDPNIFDDDDNWNDWGKRYLNIQYNNIKMPFSKSASNYFRRNYQEINGWEKDIFSALKVPFSNSNGSSQEQFFVIQLLYRSPPNQSNIPGSEPFLRAFRLQRIINGETDSVIIFDHDNPRVKLPPYRKYLDSMHDDKLKMYRFDILRDIIRAYICAGNRLDSVYKFENSLINYSFRSHLYSPDGLTNCIEDFFLQVRINNPQRTYTNISILERLINKYLWID